MHVEGTQICQINEIDTKLKELGAYNHIEILEKVPQNGEVASPDVVFP